MTETRFAGGPADSPGFLLWRATMRWQRLMTATLAPLDLTHVQFVLLACTWWTSRSGQALSQAQLAAQVGIEPKMTSDVIRRLESKGLLDRVPDPQDARANLIHLTAEGLDRTRAAIQAVEQADAGYFIQTHASEDELVTILRPLAGIRATDHGQRPRA